jgi:hypothetical protein
MERKLERLRNWAANNQHLFGLTRTVIAVTGAMLTTVGVIVGIITYMVPAFRSALWSAIIWILAKISLLVELAAALVTEHQEMVLFMAVAVIVLFVRIRSLNVRLSRLEILLDKSVSANLTNWDYHGQWSSDGRVLSVTNSDDGGLSKSGAGWENYNFVFYFRIVNACAAWIVRAESHSRYVMIQCNRKEIRLHIRNAPTKEDDQERGFRVTKELSHPLSLAEWNKVKTEVRGYGIQVFINEHWVFSDPDLLSGFPLGKVGFRSSGPEHAEFKDIEVIRKEGCSIPLRV